MIRLDLVSLSSLLLCASARGWGQGGAPDWTNDLDAGENRSHVINDDEKRLVAYHEAGHAIVAAGVGMKTGVQKLSIVARVARGRPCRVRTWSRFLDVVEPIAAGRGRPAGRNGKARASSNIQAPLTSRSYSGQRASTRNN